MKKQHQLALGIAIVCSTLSGKAQLNDFDLSSYKLPELKRQSLETNFNLNGSNSYIKENDPYFNNERELSRNRYSGSFFVDYRTFLNSAVYQRESNLRFDFQFEKNNYKYHDIFTNKGQQIMPQLNYNLVNRKYYNTELFFETNVDAGFMYYNFKDLDEDHVDIFEEETKYTNHSFEINFPLKVGSGRIEPIDDARHALYILDELAKADRVTEQMSDKAILELAGLISELKNKRFFDTRLRRIAELESLDSFLVANNYISEPDARYFTTLNDFWLYGDGPVREKGTRFSIGLAPGFYTYKNNNTANKENTSFSALLINGGFEIVHEEPLNLQWQKSVKLEVYAGLINGYYKYTDEEYSNNEQIDTRVPVIRAGFQQNMGYYPNTLTEIRFGYSLNYVKLFDKTDEQKEILGMDGKGIKAATNIAINYYISPQFRLSFNSALYYIWQKSEDHINLTYGNELEYYLSLLTGNPMYSANFRLNNLSHVFRVSLVYSIF